MYNFYINKQVWPPGHAAKLLRIMKLTTLILILFMVQVSANSFAQKISFNQKNARLIDVFNQIRQQAGVDFIFNSSTLKDAKPVNIKVNQAALSEVLEQVFKNQPLEYKIDANFVVVSRKVKSVVERIIEYFTAIDVKGTVVDEDSQPLPGATVKVKGGTQGAVTDKAGDFFLKGVPDDAVLVIAYLGYKPHELRASANMGQIKLEQIPEELQEVVINKGYYETTRELNTGSVSMVDAKTIEKQPVTNPLAALSGRMPGVFIQQTSGVPGSDFKIQIRGKNSLREDGNEPLYIVDGMPFSSEKVSSSNYTTVGIIPGGTSPLTSINPMDIETIQVLKDADATAIYGSRGANGVVLITTKRGKEGKTKLNVNYYSGMSKVNRVKLLNTQQYLDMRREAFANDGLIPTADPNDNLGQDGKGYAPDLMVWDNNRYTDWQKVFVGNTANTTSLQSQLSGGSGNTQFLFSTGFFKESSVFPGEFSFRKFSSHLAVNHQSVNRKLTVGVTVNGSQDKNDQPQADFSSQATALAPNAPALYNGDGSLNWAPNPTTGQSTWWNPMAEFERVFESNTFNIVANGTVGYQILEGLKVQAKAGINRLASDELSVLPSTWFDPALGFGSERSAVNTSDGNTQSLFMEPQLNWDKKISKGQLSFLAGGTFQHQTFKRIVNYYNDFPSNNLLRNVSAATERGIWALHTFQYKYAAIFGRINYNWEGKYVLNLTGRRDGSSRFGSGKQFANFGAVGAAWIFSKEKWLEDRFSWLSFGKLRGSYGITGNDQIGNYQFLDTYATPGGTSNSYDGVTALDPTRLYNASFGWESNVKLEAGLELGFIDDRITASATWYRNRSSDQLIGYSLPQTTGFSSIQANLAATVQNTGLEAELSSTNIKTKNLSWITSLNITVPRNKLIEFPNLDSSSYSNRYVVGQSIYVQRFFDYTGVDPQSGFYSFRDYNNDGTINSPADDLLLRVVGYDFFGGINNSITYKDFTLDVFFQAVKQTGILTSFGAGRNINLLAEVLDQNRWRKAGDQAEIQRFATEYVQGLGADANNSPYEKFTNSDGSITDASFIRLRTLSLAYQLPKKWLGGVSGQAYVRGQNLFTLTNYKGSDPETQSRNALPPLRTLTLGINITL
ncbi:MAG: SusC/RagA family TonB-linked outer membrane protein [Pedobacter sp.]|nr:MAG: SusC/RagA family TonB-linked outer membrane protein [Pedobacter sp.]